MRLNSKVQQQTDSPSLADSRSQPEQSLAHASSTMRRPPGVLIADDLGLVLVLLKREMQQLGCKVWLAADGQMVMELFEQHREAIDVVLLDVQMEKLDGPQVLAGIRDIDPRKHCCIMVHHGGNDATKDLQKLRPDLVFEKPFDPTAVAQAVLELLGPSRH